MNESLGDLDDLEDEEDQQKGPPKLFIMNLVNSYGNAQLEQLENDGQSLQITSKKNFPGYLKIVDTIIFWDNNQKKKLKGRLPSTN